MFSNYGVSKLAKVSYGPPKTVSFALSVTKVLFDGSLPPDAGLVKTHFNLPVEKLPKENTTTYFFSNITDWGPLAKSFVFSDAFKQDFQVCGLVETHTTFDSDADLVAQASAQGFTAHTNCAIHRGI